MKISFIMPAYNCESTILESINSIIKSNFEPGDEIIICNDCSTDGTKEILNNLQAEHSFIKVIEHRFNKGGGAARNTAVENSKNELIFCLDSDNILEKNSVSKLKLFLVNNNLDVACFQRLKYFIDNINNVTHEWIFQDDIVTLQDCLSKTVIPGASGNYLYTKESWLKSGGYPEFAGALDAWGFGFRQLANGFKMMAMPDSYYFHRYGLDSYWVRDSKSKNISLMALQILIPYLSLLKRHSVNYLLGRFNRYYWFENLERHPLKLRSMELDKSINKFLIKPSLFIKFIHKIKNFFK